MDKFKRYKSIVWGLVFVLVTTMLLIGYNYQADAAVGSTPSLTVQIDSTSPNPAKVGEDITITGTIIPQDFEMSQEKEIVLVLDTSTSMRNDIKENSLECKEHRVNGYCVIHNKSTCTNVESCTWEWGHDGIEKWYCTKHQGWCKEQYQKEKNKPVSSCDENPHDVRNDYCKIHDRTGKHYTKTRIGELKNAAIEFVESLKKESNVSVAVVTYDQIAVINPKEDMITSRGEKFYDISNEDEYNEIIDMIESISLRDGTNMGEGLRKAAYMIQQKGSINSNKSIVFMTDGEPNYYSCTDEKDDFYTMIDSTTPDTDGNPAGGYVPEAKEYAVEIGTILKDYCNNVFSIGYGIKSDAEGYLNEIHTSMGGRDNTFIVSTGGNITDIFNKIATDIKSTYTVSDISMNLNLSSEFTTDIGGNKISLSSIVYTTDGIVRKGKLLYKAEPVKFSFIIRGNSIGNFDVLEGSTITFPWRNNQISARVPNIKLEIVSNDNPKISAILESNKSIEMMLNGTTEVIYNINADSFEMNSASLNNAKDIVFIIDVSKGMTNVKNNIIDALENEFTSKLSDSDNIRLSLATYYGDDNVNNRLTFPEYNLNEFINKLKIVKKDNTKNDSNKNLEAAMKQAYTNLESARDSADKYIVCIGEGQQSIGNIESIKDTIQSKDYRFIGIDLSKQSVNGNIESITNSLKGTFIDGRNNNDIIPDTIKKLYGLIKGETQEKVYEFDCTLNFNLNNNFNVVSTSMKENYSLSEDRLTINNIKVTYRYNKDTREYEADNIEPVTFKISPVNNGESVLRFGESNITYNNLSNIKVSANVRTPVIILPVIVKDVTHGIDMGISNGSYNINEKTLNMASGVNITFASTARLYSNKTDIKLSINKDIDVSDSEFSNIKVYRFENNQLRELNSSVSRIAEGNNHNNYKININDSIASDTTIVIRYECMMPLNNSGEIKNSYTNIITYGEESKEATVSDNKMPDLF